MSVVFDSSALLTIAFQEEGADVAVRYVHDGILSAVNASEVVGKLLDLGFADDEARRALLAFGLAIRPFDEGCAMAAGLLRTATRKQGLSLGDRACLALAIRERARVITADRAWAGLDLGIDVQVIR